VAIFHLNARIVSRGKGQSAVAKAAYNSHDLLTNQNNGDRHDYRYKGEVAFSGIFVPKNAPDWVQELAQDRQALWSAVEKRETRKNAQLAREIEIALPHELTDKQREYLVKDFVRENFVRHGMIADVAIHAPAPAGDDRNHHAHILLTMREITPDGFGEKMRELNGRGHLKEWREKWEHLANRYLERFGHEARIDHRTLEEQGIDREPTSHVGPTATDFEREGVKTARGDVNREIEERNRERERLKEDYKAMITGEVREAWAASPDGLDFMMELNERGFCLTQDGKGHYAAVAESGFVSRLDVKTYGEAARGMKAAIEAVRRDCNGLVIPSVDEYVEELREKCEQKHAAHLGATLYDRADMVSMQRDAMRHLKDVHRIQQQAAQEREQQEQRERLEETPREPHEQARQEKEARTEQTDARAEQSDAQREREHRKAMRELWERKARIPEDRDANDYEREYARERER
jgi:hypothetical protein